jgi:hypothetical protein
MKPTPPPLSKVDLQEIQARRRDDADVMALPWEISRLRTTVLYADHLERTLGPTAGGVGMVRNALRRRLDEEPCLQEFPRLPPDA